MSDEMGTFRTDVEIENPIRPGERRILRGVLVDTGAELSSFPESLLDSLGIQRRTAMDFRQANGTILSRWTGPAFVYVAGKSATDDVVFGEPGDIVLLGARSLEGLNLHVDPIGKRLIDAGPMPAAAAAPQVMRRSRLLRPAATAVVALAAIAFTATRLDAWGESGHRMIGLAAAQALPADMPAFFRQAAVQLSYLNPEPDRWRDRSERDKDPALDGATAPDHFIDLEMIPADRLAGALAAPNRYAYADTLRQLGLAAPTVGLLPWRIVEMAQTLRLEFRLWRAASDDATRRAIEARIINDGGILGHYVADGSNPMHASLQYNGWTGANPNGYATDKRMHGRFESAYVDAQMRIGDITPLMDAQPRTITNIRAATVAYLHESNAQLERLYQIDKAAAFDAQTTAPENKKFAAERLAAGARMLRDVWYSAYVASAAP